MAEEPDNIRLPEWLSITGQPLDLSFKLGFQGQRSFKMLRLSNLTDRPRQLPSY